MRGLAAIGLIAILVIAACSDDKSTTSAASGSGGSAAAKPTISIGIQDFGESAILAEIYKQGLEAKGFTVSTQKLGGFRDLELKAFESGTINFAPEYAASMLEALNGKKGEASSDVTATVAKLDTQLTTKGLASFKVTDAVDTNAFVMLVPNAEQAGVKSLSDLATKFPTAKLGGPSDCETNPFCIPGLKTLYGVDLSGSFTALETSAVAAALDNKAIDIGILFSTDGKLSDTTKYVVLKDDKKMLTADNVIPVAKTDIAANADVTAAVNKISGYVTTDELVKMNKRFDIDKEDAAVIAKDFLQQSGLL